MKDFLGNNSKEKDSVYVIDGFMVRLGKVKAQKGETYYKANSVIQESGIQARLNSTLN